MGGAHSTAFMNFKVVGKSTDTPNTALMRRAFGSEQPVLTLNVSNTAAQAVAWHCSYPLEHHFMR